MSTAEQLQPQPPQPQAPVDERRPLEEALEAIAEDARRDPVAYHEDTRVPGGGE